jgi:hypothetical protein
MTLRTDGEPCMRGLRRISLLAIAAIVLSLPLAVRALAAPGVSRFTVTPSTTQAGGHPNLNVLMSFDPPSSDVRQIALHLPAGLSANARAAPFCPRSRLLADLCDLRTKVGSVTLAGEALGFEAAAKRNIYNLAPVGQERLRLGVPVFGSLSRGGLALMLPVTTRPTDGGLDLTLAGPPREVAGYPIRIKEIGFRIRGVVRKRVRRRVRTRSLLTSPSTCTPANSVLEVLSYDLSAPAVTLTSSFTPTGC